MIDLKSTRVYHEIHEQPEVLARRLKEERGTVETRRRKSSAATSSTS